MRVKKLCKHNSLAARWQHAERDGIVAGHMGFGSPDWAHATTHFKRPDDIAMPARETRKVTSLAKVAAFHAEKRGRIALRMDCVPCGTDFDEKGHAEKAVAETLKIGNFFARLYSGKVALQGEPKDFGSVSDGDGGASSHVPKLVWARE